MHNQIGQIHIYLDSLDSTPLIDRDDSIANPGHLLIDADVYQSHAVNTARWVLLLRINLYVLPIQNLSEQTIATCLSIDEALHLLLFLIAVMQTHR